MRTAAAVERAFPVFARGEQRDQMLEAWRAGLRELRNPDTGQPFTEDEIATATARRSRWWAEADAVDLVLQAGQRRALVVSDAVRIDRAGTGFLETYHGPAWGEDRLPAAGGSGAATAQATPGTFFPGSTIVPDPGAAYARDQAGLRYQLLFNVTTPANGVAGSDPASPMVFQAIDTGEGTNVRAGAVLTWANPPLGSGPEATTSEDFRGGGPLESDRDWSARILARIRHKPAAGNRSHVRSWARDASSSVEDACVYACAFNAGSVLVAVLQKRSSVRGALARIASAGTLARVTTYLVPPGSPVFPTPPHVVVVPCTPVPSNVVLSLAMVRGASAGWADLDPFPTKPSAAAPAAVTQVTDQTHFRVSSGSAPAPGSSAPRFMLWVSASSSFEPLLVQSVSPAGGGQYDVVLSAPPTATVTVGSVVSPTSERHALLADTVSGYFDELGPGEVVDLAADARAHRAHRFPVPSEELPQLAGAQVVTRLQDALGGSLPTSTLDAMSVTSPPLPADPIDGPALIVCGTVGVYPL